MGKGVVSIRSGISPNSAVGVGRVEGDMDREVAEGARTFRALGRGAIVAGALLEASVQDISIARMLARTRKQTLCIRLSSERVNSFGTDSDCRDVGRAVW